MVFLIQNTQNRDARAIHLKLNELIHAVDKAKNQLIDVEKLSELELDELTRTYEKIRASAQDRHQAAEQSCSAIGTNEALAESPGQIHIGISGWKYKAGAACFYPEKLPQRRELEFASRQFDTIELNGSFYSLQRPESFARWYAETPQEFTFSVKGSRYLTHMRRLREVEGPLANFFAQGLLQFGSKLGPILWQFPPNFQFEPERLDLFFALLPRTRKQAAELARNHDERLDERSWFQVRQDAAMRHAIEIRHESFVNEEFIKLLRRHGIGLV